jgi:hypothetical protein
MKTYSEHHPMTPPEELVQQWLRERPESEYAHTYIAARAAQWGADQELEACCEWAVQNGYNTIPPRLRAVRRPKPLSLKEQALEVFEALIHGDASGLDVGVIRRALEALPND